MKSFHQQIYLFLERHNNLIFAYSVHVILKKILVSFRCSQRSRFSDDILVIILHLKSYSLIT